MESDTMLRTPLLPPERHYINVLPSLPRIRKRDQVRIVWDSFIDTIVKVATFGCVPGLRHPWRALKAQTPEQKKYIEDRLAQISTSLPAQSQPQEPQPDLRPVTPPLLRSRRSSVPEHLPEGKVKKAIEEGIRLLITAMEQEYLEKFRSIGQALIGDAEMATLEHMIEEFRTQATALLTNQINRAYPNAVAMFKQFDGIHVYQEFIAFFHQTLLDKIEARKGMDEERIRVEYGKKIADKKLPAQQIGDLGEADRSALKCHYLHQRNPEHLREFFFHLLLKEKAQPDIRSIDTFSTLIKAEADQAEALLWSLLEASLKKYGHNPFFPRQADNLHQRNSRCRKAFFLYVLQQLNVLPNIKKDILAKLLEWKTTKEQQALAFATVAQSQGAKIAPMGSTSHGMALLCDVAYKSLHAIDFEDRVASLLSSTFASVFKGFLSIFTDPAQFKSLYAYKLLPSLNQVMTRELMKKIMVNNLAPFIPHFTVMITCKLAREPQTDDDQPIDRDTLFAQEKRKLWDLIYTLYTKQPPKTVKHLKPEFDRLQQDDFGFYLFEPVITECFACIMTSEAVHQTFLDEATTEIKTAAIQKTLLDHFSKSDPITAEASYGEFFSLILQELGFTSWGKDTAVSFTKDLMGRMLARMIRDFSKGDFIIKMVLDNANANFLGSRTEEARIDAIKQLLFGVHAQTRSLDQAFEEESKKLAVTMHDLIFIGNQLGGWGEWTALGLGKHAIVRSFRDLQDPIKNFPDKIMSDKLLNQQIALKVIELGLIHFAAGACKAVETPPQDFLTDLVPDPMLHHVTSAFH